MAALDCDNGDGASEVEKLETALVSGAQASDDVIQHLREIISECLGKASDCCCDCQETAADAATGLTDQAERVIERLTTVAAGDAASFLAEAQETIDAVEKFLARADDEETTADDTPILEETGELDSPPPDDEPTGPTEEPQEEIEEPTPIPDPPMIVIASSGETGLITQCRSDAYTAGAIFEKRLQSLILSAQNEAAGGGSLGKQLAGALRAAGVEKIPFVGSEVVKFFQNLETVGRNSATNVANLTGCGAAVGALLPLEAFTGLLSLFFGPGIAEVALPIAYSRRVSCPTAFPTTEQAHEAYKANAISLDILKSWAAINNDCWPPQRAIIESRRAKLSPGEILSLHLRGKLDANQFATRLREIGYQKSSDYADVRELGRFIPPYTDQVRFMVRDVNREDLVKRFGMDELFTEAFDDDAQALAGKLGIEQDTMQKLWRAHWSIPAPGQLFEMFHRLPFVDDAQVGEFNALLKKSGSQIQVTREQFSRENVRADVVQALIQQDILPFWIPRLLSLTFRPLTRREITRAAEAGTIVGNDLIDAYRQLGLSESNATKLADLAAKRRDDRASSLEPIRLFKAEQISAAEARKRLGEFGITEARITQAIEDAAAAQDGHTAVKLYKSESISRAQATERLAAHGIPEKHYKQWLDDIDAQRKDHVALKRYRNGTATRDQTETQMVRAGLPNIVADTLIRQVDSDLEGQLLRFCAVNIEKRFLAGELTAPEGERELGALGMAPHLVDWWRRRMLCKQKAIGKAPPTSRLAKWFEQGIISAETFVTRMIRIGWTRDDALNILRQSVAKLREDVAKANERDAKKALKDAEAAEKDRQRRAKQTEAELARNRKAQAAAAKARERREKRLVEAADRLREKMGSPLAEAMRLARSAVLAGRREFGLGPDERLDVLEVAVKRFDPDSDATFLGRYRTLAAARQFAPAIV